MEQVIILFSGDSWLSTSSLRIVGVFSDEENFTKYAKELLNRGDISDWGYKSLTGYYGTGRQCDTKHGALLVSIYDLNPDIEGSEL